MRRVLTDAFLRGLKPPPAGRVEIADLRCAGLAFRLTSAGAASWSFRFRDPEAGKPARANLGRYPGVGLGKAREAADRLRGEVAAGTNPNHRKRVDRETAVTRTFGALADRYVAEHARRKKRASSAAADELNLRVHILPKWRSRPFATITRADAVELIEALIVAGKPTTANRVHSLVSKIFGFAVDAGILGANPIARLRKRAVETPRQRVLTDEELRTFWHGIVEPPVSRRVGLGLRLVLLTGCRPGQVAGARRSEFDGLDDAGGAVWTVPSERMKGRRGHVVPLTPAAIEIVQELLALVDDDAEPLFPARSNDDGGISAGALPKAMARFVAHAGKDCRSLKMDPPTPHDLRRSCNSRLAALGVDRETREALLAHAPTTIEGRHYNAHERLAEKRAALQRWAAALDAIVDPPKSSAAVVPIRSARR